MNKKSADEDISCLIDGELDESRTRTALKRLQSDTAARDAWERYYLIGDVMRRLRVVAPESEFARRVATRIASEPPVVAPRAWRRHAARAVRPAAGLALAASVMAFAVLQLEPNAPAPGAEEPLAEAQPGASGASSDTRPSDGRAESDIALDGVRPIPAATRGTARAQYAGVQRRETEPRIAQPVYYWDARDRTRNRYNGYLVKHNQYAASQAQTGFVNYARIVGADHAPVTEQQPEAQ